MKHLSDQQLLGELRSLRTRERKTTLSILRYLNEIERRKLFLRLGYGSLFAFVTQHLRYSESAAGRRIQVARCLREHPEVRDMLLRHEVNLSTVALVSRALNEANKVALLAKIRRKSQREVEAIVADAKPATPVRDRIKAVKVPTSGGAVAPHVPASNRDDKAKTVKLPRTDVETDRSNPGVRSGTDHSRSGSRTECVPREKQAEPQAEPHAESCAEHCYKVEFAARRQFLQKFEEARALLSGRFPAGVPFAEVFEAALDAFLEKKSPLRRKARREQRAALRADRRPAPESAGSAAECDRTDCDRTACSGEETNARGQKNLGARAHIPIAVRDAVFARDEGRCTYVGTNGRRCGSRHDVEIDHVQPVARGGSNAIDNLRLLCAGHNRLMAERIYGRQWMQRYDSARQHARVAYVAHVT